MNLSSGRRRRGILTAFATALVLLSAGYFYLYGQNKSGFPDGYDAVQAAPDTHKVIFENKLVRVLEVSTPPSKTIPMHHHRWPSFFLSWDTGGPTPHIRYRRPDGTVRDSPSVVDPVHPGSWSVGWMEPEPMHSIEVVDAPATTGPTDLRIEIKCHP